MTRVLLFCAFCLYGVSAYVINSHCGKNAHALAFGSGFGVGVGAAGLVFLTVSCR